MSSAITWTQARRIALRAQGMGRPRRAEVPDRRASREALRRTVELTHLLQIDSVSVFARAHLMPVFTRTGCWDTRVLDAASRPGPGRLLTECMAHEAALVPPEVHALLAFRRRAAAQRDWGAIRRAAGADPRRLAEVEEALRREGPVSAAALSRAVGDARRPENGWGWRRTDTQWMVEYLFRSGRIACVGRNAQFERLYATADQAGIRAPGDEDVPDDEAVLALVRRAAGALGIASPADIADYFRLPQREIAAALSELQRTGELIPVTVTRGGATDLRMLLWAQAAGDSPVRAAALVSPFDPIAFHRRRLRDLFAVDYRIGIYTPADQRTHGYYPLPFLLGDRIEARVDLRADRARGVLEVKEAHREPVGPIGARGRPDDTRVAVALAEELARACRWQGLSGIEVHERGDLAPSLARAVG